MEDRTKRDRFYRSRRWASFSKRLKFESRNDRGFLECKRCRREIPIAHQAIAHHKIELTEENVDDVNISMNPDNIEIICHQCHNSVHDRFGNLGQKEVIIVWGPPHGNKMKYVEDHFGPHDIIVEVDRIYDMLNFGGRYTKSQRIKTNVFDVRRMLYDSIQTRRGKWEKAWVVATLPYNGERNRLKDQLMANDVIYVDATKEECYENIDNNINIMDKETHKGYVDDFFSKVVK